MIPIEDLEKKIEDYKEKKTDWMPLAKELDELDEHGFDLNTLNIAQQRSQELVKAYRLVKTRRPEWIDNPTNVPASSIAYLVGIYKRMKQRDKEADFEELLDNVLSGKTRYSQIVEISKKYRRSGNITMADLSRDAADEEAEKPITNINALESSLKTALFLTDEVMNNDINKARAHLGGMCRALSDKLQCIADSEFYRLWKQRKRETI